MIRLVFLLVTAAFVALPILVAVALVAAGVPSWLGPILVVASGIGWVLLTGRTVVKAERHFAAAAGVPLGEGLEAVEGQQWLAERPHMVWVPFLVTASWIDVLIGLVWLAFVDLRVLLGTVGVLVIAWFAWKWWGPPTDLKAGRRGA